MNIKDFEKVLSVQVQKEYQAWFDHIRPERERKRNILQKLIQTQAKEWQVRVNLLWKNIQLEHSLFVSDDLSITTLSNWWILDEKIMANANLVLKYDDIDMEQRETRETIINHNWLYWLSVTVIDARDDVEYQPIWDVLDPLAIIIDPQNYSWSKMRYFWVERRVNKEYIENTPWYSKDITFTTSLELDRNKQSSDYANNLRYLVQNDDDWYIDIYDHFTIYKWAKYLTTWANERNILLRVEKIEGLSAAEIKKPSKCKFPIQLHRRKPKYGSVFGVSIADEVLMFQDAISILTNLQLIQANQIALWPDTFVDSKIWVDTEMLSQWLPWGRVIPVNNVSGFPTQNGIYTNTLSAPSQFIDNQIMSLESRAEWTTTINNQAFWNSQPWTQTKAEIQTLQQNTNQILMWIWNNYMKWQKEYWTEHYKSYCKFFSKGKKNISLFQKWVGISKSLIKEDFILDWKVSVFIWSKAQDAIENDKEFNKITILATYYLQNMKPWYAMNDFLRLLGKKSNIRDFDEYRYISQTPDEMNAEANLSLINKNIKIPWPQEWEDFLTYISIYRQALDTDVRREVLMQYETAYKTIQQPTETLQENGTWNQSVSWMAMNNLQQQQVPSTALVGN